MGYGILKNGKTDLVLVPETTGVTPSTVRGKAARTLPAQLVSLWRKKKEIIKLKHGTTSPYLGIVPFQLHGLCLREMRVLVGQHCF